MTTLAIEFSSARRSVALVRGENVLAEAVETGDGRGTNAFGLIEKVLAESKIPREEIETIVVGLGPGSYTGIRAAISIAQGWQLAGNVKLFGVSSVEAIVAKAKADGIFGRVNVIVDAQRNEFYLAAYEISANGWKEIEPLKILPMLAIQKRAETEEVIAGPDATKWIPFGKVVFPESAVLAKIAATKNEYISGEQMEPIYLREVSFVKSVSVKTVNL